MDILSTWMLNNSKLYNSITHTNTDCLIKADAVIAMFKKCINMGRFH